MEPDQDADSDSNQSFHDDDNFQNNNRKKKSPGCCKGEHFQQIAIILNLFVAGIYLSLWFLSRQMIDMESNSQLDNTSIYTQALDDWNTDTWSDFRFDSGSCASGYTPIGSEWLGSRPANYTDGVIIPAEDQSLFASDVSANPEVYQKQILAYILCGKPIESNFMNMPLTSEEQNWECPTGTGTACSTNTGGGVTVCATSETECPITDIRIFDDTWHTGGSQKYKNYQTITSGRWTSTKSNNEYYIAFTKKNALDGSNVPMQQLSWQSGKPCAFPDQAQVHAEGEDKPVLHSLERASGLEECQNLDIVNDSGEV